MRYDIVALYVCIDDFCKLYEEASKQKLLSTGRIRNRAGNMSLSEMLTVMVIFHYSPCKNFKYFYTDYLAHKHKKDFPKLLCYERFVQLMHRLFVPLSILLHSILGEKTGIYIPDATSLPVCRNQRIRRHRVFNNLAKRGKTAMGWFYGFKLHMIINHKGEIVAVKVTPGNVDDRSVLDSMTRHLKGKIFADKGYISKKLFKSLYMRGLKLVTGIKRNMKNHLMDMIDKLLLRKRFIIETIFAQLKINFNLTHTRSRSPINFFLNILSCLTAYQLKSTKPNISLIHY